MKSGMAASLLLLALLSSCSSIRLRYTSDVDADNGRKGEFVFEKSYKTDPIPVFCGLTAVFLGGACWYYLAMPTTGQEQRLQADADKALAKLLGDTGYTETSPVITQQGWHDRPETLELQERAH